MRTFRGDKTGFWAFFRPCKRGDGPQSATFEMGLTFDGKKGQGWLLSIGIAPGFAAGFGWVPRHHHHDHEDTHDHS